MKLFLVHRNPSWVPPPTDLSSNQVQALGDMRELKQLSSLNLRDNLA